MLDTALTALLVALDESLKKMPTSHLAPAYNAIRPENKPEIRKFKDAETGLRRIGDLLTNGTLSERADVALALVAGTDLEIDPALVDAVKSALRADSGPKVVEDGGVQFDENGEGDEKDEPIPEWVADAAGGAPVVVAPAPSEGDAPPVISAPTGAIVIPTPSRAPAKGAAKAASPKKSEAASRTEKVVETLKLEDNRPKHIDEIQKLSGLAQLFIRNGIDAARRQGHDIRSMGKGVFAFHPPAP